MPQLPTVIQCRCVFVSPTCEKPHLMSQHVLEWITENGLGYAQNSFFAKCPASHCQIEVTREVMAVGRLAVDVCKVLKLSQTHLLYAQFRLFLGQRLSIDLPILDHLYCTIQLPHPDFSIAKLPLRNLASNGSGGVATRR